MNSVSVTSPMKKPEPLSSLVASARRIKNTDRHTGKQRTEVKRADWQEEAWDLYDMVGELRFLTTTVAGRLGQAHLYVGKQGEKGEERPERIEDPEINDLLLSIGGSRSGQSQILTRLAINLTVPGEGWLAGIPASDSFGNRPAAEDVDPMSLEWTMLSVSEVSSKAGSDEVTLNLDGTNVDFDPSDIFLIRVWNPHPRKSWEADSPTRAAIPILKELVGLTMHISAQVDSRLAGAGLLIVPQSAQRAVRAAAGIDEDDDQDVFTEAMLDAMMTPIGDRSSASAVVPLVVTVPDDSADKFQHISFSTNLDAEARNLRDESIRRMAMSLDAPPELLLGTSGMNHWGCVDTDTEILTRDKGWVTEDRLNAGDVILTLNHDTGQQEWQAVQAVQRYQVDDTPMLRMQGQGHDSLTTLNHRWPVISAFNGRRKFVTSEELNHDHRIPTAATPHAPEQANYSDALVELAAWYWTEGSRSVSDAGVVQASISQSHVINPDRVARIRAALRSEYGDEWGSEHERTGGGYGHPVTMFSLRSKVAAEMDALAPRKVVSEEFVRALTLSQLELFIDISCQGDGWHYRQGHLDIWQREAEQLEPYALALILSGRMVAWSEHADGYVVNGYRKDTVRPIKAGIDRIENYTGTIWCPTVENSTWLARRNGTVWYTGNSWLVQEETVTSHIEPPLALICDALTTQYLWPALEAQGHEDFEDYVVWYDVDHLIIRPTVGQDALNLHERNALSDNALRRVHGFDESDAPEDMSEDPAVGIVLEMVQAAPALLSSPGIGPMLASIRGLIKGEEVEPIEGAEDVENVPEEPEEEPEAVPGAPPRGIGEPDLGVPPP